MSDLDAIRELIDVSVRVLQAGDYTAKAIDASLKTVFTIDTQLIHDGTYFAAFTDEGELAGCGGWSKRKTLYGGDQQVEKIEPDLLDPSRDAAKVRAIFVHPKFARNGLGSLILSAAEDASMKAGFRLLEMGSTLTGVRLYLQKGYREVERVRVPVGDDESIEVVRMIKEVDFIRPCPI